MEISAADATSLLKKWFDERTPIRAMFISSDGLFSTKMSGFVNGLSSNGLLIASSSSFDTSTPYEFYIVLDGSRTVSYHYGEVKDMGQFTEEVRAYFSAQHGIANVSILFDNGSRLSLFEKLSN